MRSQGFIAITELVIVLAVISALAGVGTATYLFAKNRAKEVKALDDMGSWIAPAMERFKLDIGYYPHQSLTQTSGYGLFNDTDLTGEDQQNWAGPYLRVPDANGDGKLDGNDWPNDPFGNPYVVIGDGVSCVAIASCGRDSVCASDPVNFLKSLISDMATCQFSAPWNPETGKFDDGDSDDRDPLGYVFTPK